MAVGPLGEGAQVATCHQPVAYLYQLRARVVVVQVLQESHWHGSEIPNCLLEHVVDQSHALPRIVFWRIEHNHLQHEVKALPNKKASVQYQGP